MSAKTQRTTMQELSDDAEVISRYTCEDAVNDGVLFHPYPKQWPWLLISTEVNAACQEDPESTDSRTFDQKCVPLCKDAIMAAQRPDANDVLQRDGHLTLEGTVAETIWIVPNDKGGMTLLQPHER